VLYQLVALGLPFEYTPTLGLLIGLYTVADLKGRRFSLAALVITVATLVPVAVAAEVQTSADDAGDIILTLVVFFAILCGGIWALGRLIRRNRTRIDTLQRLQQEVAQAVQAERRLISRELHDIVSHSVSVMVLQAAGARRHASDTARVEEALGHIQAVGRQSMVELRRLLGVLDDARIVDSTGTTGPPHGIADVPALVEGLDSSELHVRLVVEGRAARLDPSVDLSAYRIVQESLTNSIKHSGRGATVVVRIAWAPSVLTLEVTDDGGAAAGGDASLSTEHGLPGLRERARAVGGHLEAGPDPAGGFRVAATLPLSSSGSADSPATAGRPG
jgi:signal transduction histidine kinase